MYTKMSQNTQSYNEEYPDLPYIQTFQPFQLDTIINKTKTIKTSYKKPCVQTYVHNNQIRHHLKKKKSFLFYKKQIFIGSGKTSIKSSNRQTNTEKSTINKTTHIVKGEPKVNLKAKCHNIYTYLETEEVSHEELHNIKVNDNVNEIKFSQSNSNNLQNPSSKKKRNRQKKFKKNNNKKTFENEQKTSLYYQSFTEYASFLETIKKQDLTSCDVHQKFCDLEKKQIYIYLPDSGMSVFQSCHENVLVSDIARHVKSKYNMPFKSQHFRTLNGKSLNKNSVINHTKIQNIALYFNLKGGVFKNNSYHENKKCGPCVLCGLDQSSCSSIRYMHLTETQITWKSITDKKSDISMEDCLCRSCYRRLEKKENESKSGIPSKKKHIPCFLNKFNKCENPSEREVDYEPLLVEHFNVTIKEETMYVTLCHLHYLEYHNKKIGLKNYTCVQCSNTTNLKPVTEDLLLKHNKFKIFSNNCQILSNLNLICDQCSEKILFNYQIMSLKQIKADWDKHKSIEISHAIENYSVYHCVNYICDTFLQENVCLLSDVISIYTKSHEKYCEHWNLSDSGTKLTNKGLLSKLGAVFEGNLTVFTSKNKKLGTLLYCPGINIQTSMLLLLNQIKIIKKSSNKTEIVNQNQSPDTSSSPQSQFQDLKINLQKMCRNLIDAQCYNEISLESFNVISFINTYLDPYVWNFFYSFFSSTPITDNTKCYLPQPDTSNKTLMFRCLNVISILLFAMDSRCQIPIPTLVAEVVDKYTSSSSECLKILNNFGICISKDTLQRYQNLIALRNKSEGLKLPPDTFVTVSIDNINKRFPNATVKVSDQCRGFDGTSIQLVLPNPSQLVLKNVEKGEFLIDSVTADCGTVFKVIKVGSEKSLFKSCLSTLSKTLATAKRNCDGFCIDEAISLLEENKASTIENLIKTCFNSNLNLVTSSNSNVKCNFSEEFAAFSFLTGSNVNIFSVSETIPSQISLVSAFHHPKSLGKHSCNILMTLEKTFCVLLPMDVYYSDFEYLNDELDLLKNIRCLNGVSHDPLTYNCGYLDVKNTENEKHKDIKPRKRVLVTESETFNSNNINIHQQSINEQPFFIQTKSIHELETNITHLSNEEKDIKQKFQSNMFTYCSKKYFTSQSDEIVSNSLDSFKTVMSKTEQPNTCKSTVKYLEILEENADDKETIRNILYKLHDKFAIGRHFNNLVVVGDGKTYSHLIKLKEENIEDLQWMLPYLGDWHTLKNYQFVIMKIYLDLGLQSFIDLFHKGALSKAISSAISFEKTHDFLLQFWESLFRYELAYFFKHRQDENNVKMPNIQEVKEVIDNFSTTESEITFENKFYHLQNLLSGTEAEFHQFYNNLCAKNRTWKVWHRCLHEDLFTYVCHFISFRTGNWPLRMACIKHMAKMSQICGSTYYSRLLPQHLSDIECYPKEVVDHLKMGGFSMNIKGFNWHSQALDEGHETCINRDLKHVLTTATGSSFLKFINYMPTRAATLANIKMQLNISEYKLSEPSKKLLVDIELNIGALLEKWNNSALALDLVKTENLLHLFKFDKAGTTSQIENIVNLHNTADSHFKQYIKSSLSTSKYLFPKQKMLRLTGFGANKTPTTSNVKKSLKDKQQELKMTKIIMEWSNEQNVAVTNLDQFISLPRAIALENGDMVTSSSKSKCKETYKKIYKESFKTGLDLSSMDSIVLDAMFIVHNTPVRFYKRFSEYLSSLFVKYVSTLLKDVKEVIIAFDYQTLSDKSPKQLLRNKRDGDDFSERLIHFNRESSLPSNWKTFIKNRENKQQLVNLICEEFVLLGTKLLQPGKVIIIGGGFLDSHKTVHVELGTSYELGTHITNIDEGDSLVWFYALKSKYDNIVIYSPDNDVYHIGLPLISDIINKIVVILTDFNDKNYIKINTLKNEIAQDLDFMSDHTDVALIFQVFYICTGCDYVSFFIGNGKVSFFKTLKTHFKFINSENGGIFTGRLSFFNGSNYMIGFLAFVRLVCCQYLSKCKYAFTCISPTLVSPESIFLHFRQEDLSEFENHRIFVDKIRQSLFYRAGSEENYLPSYDALLLHWKRTCWVARVWQQCLSSCVLYPRIEDHGWEIKENRIKVIWDSDENFAKVDANIKLWTVGCECLKSMCGTKTCGCRKRNKHCGPACLKCRGCCLNQIKSFDNISDSELHDSIVAVDSNETSAELPLTEDDFIESESEEEFD